LDGLSWANVRGFSAYQRRQNIAGKQFARSAWRSRDHANERNANDWPNQKQPQQQPFESPDLSLTVQLVLILFDTLGPSGAVAVQPVLMAFERVLCGDNHPS
jgi:hypothetical protein